MTDLVAYAIEHADSRPNGYHSIHRPGCRDLRDGEVFWADAATIDAIADVLQNDFGYDYDPEYIRSTRMIMPCTGLRR